MLIFKKTLAVFESPFANTLQNKLVKNGQKVPQKAKNARFHKKKKKKIILDPLKC
jgi:hypothetical protein